MLKVGCLHGNSKETDNWKSSFAAIPARKTKAQVTVVETAVLNVFFLLTVLRTTNAESECLSIAYRSPRPGPRPPWLVLDAPVLSSPQPGQRATWRRWMRGLKLWVDSAQGRDGTEGGCLVHSLASSVAVLRGNAVRVQPQLQFGAISPTSFSSPKRRLHSAALQGPLC